MFFNSVTFFVFLGVVLALYAVLPHRWQNRMLLVASYVFYGAWDWRFLSLIWISTIIDYWCGLAIAASAVQRRRRLLLGISMVSNLGLLAFFKYFNFFAESLQVLLAGVGLDPGLPSLTIILPVGISFYTFQTMSYTIDIYRKEMEPTRSLSDFALFVAYFPQLVAGPIERAADLLPRLVKPRKQTWEMFSRGAVLILYGLFQKAVVADTMAIVADRVFSGPGEYGSLHALLGVYAFAFQILCDFAGYSNIARGASLMLGIELMVNFRFPYFASNPSDFWQRWHISLSTWLRDYLYIPLGGNRGGTLMTHRNLMLTMLLGGLWHGAAWTFVVWGGLHGLVLVLYRKSGLRKAVGTGVSGVRGALAWLLPRVFFFHVVCLTWIFFRAESLGDAMVFLEAMTRPVEFGAALGNDLLKVFPWWIAIMVIECFQYRSDDTLVMMRWPLAVRVAFYLFLVYAIIVFAVSQAQSFIYFQF